MSSEKKAARGHCVKGQDHLVFPVPADADKSIGKKREFSYHPLDLKKGMGGLVHTESEFVLKLHSGYLSL